MKRLELVAVSNSVERAREVAETVGGTLLFDPREGEALPFRALVAAVTDDAAAVLEAADVGAYVVCRRVMKSRPEAPTSESGAVRPGAIALFTMVHHPDLSHREADLHWRDQHTPLALRHHVAMTHYTQLSIVHRIAGPEWDGFALCGFDSLEDLKQRFYETDEGRRAIREDVARFADARRSPRRLIAMEASYEQPG